MTMPDDLIACLDAATEGSKEIDKEIARARGFVIAASTGGPHIMRKPAKTGDPSWDLPRYSRSLDAALMLAGERWLLALVEAIHALKVWMKTTPSAQMPTREARSDALLKRLILNVCIAALKARAGEEKKDT